MSLRANLETEPRTGERRSAPRRKLRLQAEGAIPSAGDTQVVIHDISEEGLLIESPLPLTDGEVLEVLIPEAGTAQAEVSWTSGHFYGCKFSEPISTAIMKTPTWNVLRKRPRTIIQLRSRPKSAIVAAQVQNEKPTSLRQAAKLQRGR